MKELDPGALAVTIPAQYIINSMINNNAEIDFTKIKILSDQITEWLILSLPFSKITGYINNSQINVDTITYNKLSLLDYDIPGIKVDLTNSINPLTDYIHYIGRKNTVLGYNNSGVPRVYHLQQFIEMPDDLNKLYFNNINMNAFIDSW